MAYITDEKGRVKIISSKGKTKFVSKIVAENAKVMYNTGFSIVETPENYPPIKSAFEDKETEFDPENIEEKSIKRTYNKRK